MPRKSRSNSSAGAMRAPISTCNPLHLWPSAIASSCAARTIASASCIPGAGAISTRCAKNCIGMKEVPEMTLRRIALRDFVIVRALELDLSKGFTVLTGETGAGKSILIDALQLALGNRADAGSVREGAERLDVSAEFDGDPALSNWLDEGGFEAGDFLLLRRTVDLQGRSRGWINGSPATATQLRELGDRLLDIHGQHAWQSLTRPEAVRGLLDAYAGVTSTALDGAWHAW